MPEHLKIGDTVRAALQPPGLTTLFVQGKVTATDVANQRVQIQTDMGLKIWVDGDNIRLGTPVDDYPVPAG